MSAAGRVAYQTIETLAGRVARETAQLQNLPPSVFSTGRRPVRLAIQLDDARRRTRQFVACVLNIPQLSSQS
eukprot:4876576-Pleurochrysis_carterae.AAC.1